MTIPVSFRVETRGAFAVNTTRTKIRRRGGLSHADDRRASEFAESIELLSSLAYGWKQFGVGLICCHHTPFGRGTSEYYPELSS